ncbi:MBOAT family protein [Clostridium sp. 'deep sea']|uniref:MBOAT family O-acyltransferase n=1 Tax=Clostridium sp. 'deep sea' TaxID=2779445 RepID=UPI0018969AC1|nr:MBOAT family protein [Clostridium sp. 'deep sea']QOR35248.1 MBOAT family protein [Clostridium sp. 'deep sea']
MNTLIYAVCPRKQRYIVLLMSSLIFYSVFSGYGVLLLLCTIITTHYTALVMDKIGLAYITTGLAKPERKKLKAQIKHKKRLVLCLCIVINVGILLITKYFNFFSRSFSKLIATFGLNLPVHVIKIILPLGISYYTLQALSYVIDVFRGKYPAEKNILKTALFIGFFPQLHEGPFGRYDKLMPVMSAGKQINSENLYEGIARFLWGFFKIFMVANRVSLISDMVFNDYSSYGGFAIIIGIVAFTIQLYAEFSGYIDIAVGIAKVLGIELAKNFDMPFISQNVAEFWRRWHISLGLWFRDYVFYPVSTSKVMSKLRKKVGSKLANFVSINLAMLTVWFLTGMWHGASVKYIVYGLYYFALIMLYNLLSPYIEKLLKKYEISAHNKILITVRIIKTLILVGIGMLIFRAKNLRVFRIMLMSVFTKGTMQFNILAKIDLKDLIILCISFGLMLLPVFLKTKNIEIDTKYNSLSSIKKYWICFTAFSIIVIFGAYGFGYLPPDPIYGGF